MENSNKINSNPIPNLQTKFLNLKHTHTHIPRFSAFRIGSIRYIYMKDIPTHTVSIRKDKELYTFHHPSRSEYD